jgi:cysteine synthase
MAVALLAAARGYALTLVTASSLIDAKYKARLERIGATVIAIDDVRGDGNQPGRLECLQTILTSDPECFWTRQYDSPENWLAYARLAEFLVRTMGRSYDDAESAAGELSSAANRLKSCAENQDYDDDCSSEMHRAKSAHSDYESAVSDVDDECD